ncbi:MAG TPA: DUF177 domain-containing protein [Beijerinckiaceae bacterium]|nr:DUF177 domain-containing protein [Beijerinckiaceae bacterium]
MAQKPLDRPPLSRPFMVDDWRDDEAKLAFVADEAEREALATALGLPAVTGLSAEFKLVRRTGGRIHATGHLSATIIRICVVSLDPFETEVSEPIDVIFASEAESEATRRRLREGHDISDATPEAEPPDPIIDGQIDLGVLATEFLALGLDPYPRKPGADFIAPREADSAGDSPFTVLGQLTRPPDSPKE